MSPVPGRVVSVPVRVRELRIFQRDDASLHFERVERADVLIEELDVDAKRIGLGLGDLILHYLAEVADVGEKINVDVGRQTVLDSLFGE